MPHASPIQLARMPSLGFAVLLFASGYYLPGGSARGEEPDSPLVALDTAESEEVTALLRRVSKSTAEKLQSGSGVGVFRRYVQLEGEEEPQLRTEARVHIHFDRGKYRFRFDITRMLIRTTYRDAQGNSTTRLADWKYDDVVLIDDGDSAYLIKFSQRIRPTGCSGEVFANRSSGLASAIGISWDNPAEYWKWEGGLNLDVLLSHLRADELQLQRTAAGDYRGSYRIRNSPKNRIEFRTSAQSGHRIVQEQVHNTEDETRTSTVKLTWNQIDGTWYISSYKDEHTSHRREGDRERIREEFEFESFSPNAAVDPELFKLESLPIPGNTRFLDRRPGEHWRKMYPFPQKQSARPGAAGDTAS